MFNMWLLIAIIEFILMFIQFINGYNIGITSVMFLFMLINYWGARLEKRIEDK